MACTCRNISFAQGHDDLLRRVRDALRARIGNAGYAAAVVYGLTLAAAHLGIDAPDPLPLPPRADTDGLPSVPKQRKPR
jgi:hypothetical protein